MATTDDRPERSDRADGSGLAPPPWREVFQGSRGRLAVGLLILESLMAVEALVVITIMPAVNREFGAVHLYGWAFAAFSLATFGAIPVSGRAADRHGPAPVLAINLVVYLLGLIVAATAPAMLILLLGRFLQGVGAGGLYAVSLGAVAKSFPKRLRARVLALLVSMWVLPGLFGPPFGALVASTVGWRWAFVAPIPLMALASSFVFPALSATIGKVPRAEGVPGERLPVRWPLQLMLGAGLFLSGLTDASARSLPLILVGLLIGLPALRRIVPEGALTARRGVPSAATAAFLLSASFFAVDGFLPLMLTEVRGLSLTQASLIVTLASVTWGLGAWWQSRRAGRARYGRLVSLGTVAVVLGTLAVGMGLLDVPIQLVYAGWMLAGLGMGVAFPTIPLAVMNRATEGKEAGELSSVLLMDMLGVGLGAGLGGSAIAVAERLGASLDAGLAGAFAIALAAGLLLFLVAPRLPEREPDGV